MMNNNIYSDKVLLRAQYDMQEMLIRCMENIILYHNELSTQLYVDMQTQTDMNKYFAQRQYAINLVGEPQLRSMALEMIVYKR